jgi:hypothetical protein
MSVFSWESYLAPSAEEDLSVPAAWTGGGGIDCPTEWIDLLLSDSRRPQAAAANPGPEPALELEDRGIEISNFDPETIARDVLSRAEKFGDVEKINVSSLSSGRIIVKFYDLRASQAMRRATIRVGNLIWQIQFAHPEKIANLKRPPNTGTLVLFHVSPSMTQDVIRSEFEKYGDLRDIRMNADNYFVEYWDLRDCEKAYEYAKTKKMHGTKINLECSRPGGIRKNADLFLTSRKPVVSRAVRKPPPVITVNGGRLTEHLENALPSIELRQKSNPPAIRSSVCRTSSN